jgi:hypothetical protein
MDLARELEANGIPGLLFQSVVGGDDNLVIYLANCSPKMLALKNERQVIDQAKELPPSTDDAIGDWTLSAMTRSVHAESAASGTDV